jgi:flagellar protein FliL
MEETKGTPAAAAPKKRGFMKLVMIFAFLLVAGGGGAWFFLGGETAKAETEPGLEERGLLAFETLLVNLADNGGQRFLKVTIQLVLGSPHEAEAVHATPVVVTALRSSMLEVLTQQQASVLVTAEGKTALKKELKARAEAHLKHSKVIDVLFSEFVVQF